MDLYWALGNCLFMVSTIHGSVLGSEHLSVYGEYHPWPQHIHGSVLCSGYLSVYGEYHPRICVGALGNCLFMVSTIHRSVLGSGYLSVYGEHHLWICAGLWVPVC